MIVYVPVSVGELLDKITILKIKALRMKGDEKIRNVNRELALLEEIASKLNADMCALEALIVELYQVNSELWDIEDGKRDAERRQCFDAHFVALARDVYLKNDRRAALKREINVRVGSDIVEEKSY